MGNDRRSRKYLMDAVRLLEIFSLHTFFSGHKTTRESADVWRSVLSRKCHCLSLTHRSMPTSKGILIPLKHPCDSSSSSLPGQKPSMQWRRMRWWVRGRWVMAVNKHSLPPLRCSFMCKHFPEKILRLSREQPSPFTESSFPPTDFQ